jgi:signal transduction histidine kinase
VAEEERNRIARDIHDGVAQSMYALSLSLEACVEAAARANSPLTERLERLVPLARNTLLETRHYIYDLKPLLSGETDIAAVAENQVREFKMVSGVPTTLALEGDPPAVDIPTTTTFYRVLQEALSNVLKHAHASNVSVRLLFSPQSVTLCVEDDGRGFDIDNAPSGYGLDNIRSRVAEMRGTVEVSSAPNRGTRLTVVLPAKGAVA